MSIETRLEELTEAIKTLPLELSRVLANTSPAPSQTEKPSAETQPKVDSTPKDTDGDSGEKADSDKKDSDQNIAGRKTYVWDKKAHTGLIVEKGEVVPTGDSLVNVGKTKWEQLCEKYDLDVATGQPVEQEEPANDLDDDLPSEDDGLGLDDSSEETGLTKIDVKKRLVEVMNTVGREDALKVMRKHGGARNFDEIKESDYQAVYEAAGELLETV